MVKKCPKLLSKLEKMYLSTKTKIVHGITLSNIPIPNHIKMNLIVENSLKIYPDKRSNLHKGT